MDEIVKPEESISRFYFSKKDVRPDNTIKHNVFMPPSNGRMSVYRTSDLQNQEIWEIGKAYVEPARGKPIVGRGDLSAIDIYNCELEINPTLIPHPKHADVEGWELDTEKDRLKALKLAASASNHLIF
jgi:hypothetical protein